MSAPLWNFAKERVIRAFCAKSTTPSRLHWHELYMDRKQALAMPSQHLTEDRYLRV